MNQFDTRKKIELAIARIQRGRPLRISKDRRLSIAAVAEEADVGNATIHNRYPDVAEEIRELVKQTVRNRREARHGTVDRLRQLRKEVARLKSDLANSQSINLRLHKENELLRTRLESHRVSDQTAWQKENPSHFGAGQAQ